MKRRHIQKQKHTPKAVYTSKERVNLSRYIRLVVGIIIACILFLVLWNAHYLIALPSHTLGGSSFAWSGGSDVNILLARIQPNNTITDISVLSVDKTSYRIVPLPASVYLTEQGSYTQLGSIYAIASLQNSSRAINFLMQDFLDNTNIHLDGYFFIHSQTSCINLTLQKFSIAGCSIPWILTHTQTMRFFLDNSYTNLTLSSLFALDNTLTANLQPQILTPGSSDIIPFSEGKMINTTSFVGDISDNLSDTYITDEHARISIYNASNITGEASLLSSMLQAEGALIDYTGDSTNTQSETQIYGNSHQFPATIKALKQLFPDAKIVNNSYDITSDVSIILGTDANL